MGRRSRREVRATPAAATPAPGRGWRVSLALFALAFAVRLLYWQATPDRSWPYSVAFKGDAPVWLQYAQALQRGLPVDLDLPIHPPGAGYLTAALWNGTVAGVGFVRFAWVAMGALVVLAFHRALLRTFPARVAAGAAGYAAVATGLVVLSSSINNETPYLLLVAAAFAVLGGVGPPGSRVRLALWGLLNGLACLVRVEHALFFALWLALLAWRGRAEARRTGASLGLAVFVCALALAPWHLHAWASLARFQDHPVPPGPEDAALAAMEASLAPLAWDEGAQAALERMPRFARRQNGLFVAATVAHRGGTAVRAEDFAVLEDAFGYVPRPLARRPFVSIYGPLNFALANDPAATGGFSAAPLERMPPLRPSPDRFPPALVGAPPTQLAFVYPPHLRLVNDGYRIGLAHIAEDPARFGRLAARKLAIFWSGAASGVTGYGVPAGATGPRRAVDMVAPDGWAAVVFAIALVGACAWGAWLARGQAAAVPWLLFLGSKVAVTIAFFGYARQGAAVIPVVALLLALAFERATRAWPPARTRNALLAAAGICLALETVRFVAPPALAIDGRPVERGDPFPMAEQRDRRIDAR
ncbi:MAG: hypothetical protein ABW221_17405 [Vicinamibacteria bacterium]